MLDLTDPWTIVCAFTATAIILSITAVAIAHRRADRIEDETYRWNDHQ